MEIKCPYCDKMLTNYYGKFYPQDRKVISKYRCEECKVSLTLEKMVKGIDEY